MMAVDAVEGEAGEQYKMVTIVVTPTMKRKLITKAWREKCLCEICKPTLRSAKQSVEAKPTPAPSKKLAKGQH